MGINKLKKNIMFVIFSCSIMMIGILYIKGRVEFEFTYSIYTKLSYFGIDVFNPWAKKDILLIFPLCLQLFMVYWFISYTPLERSIKMRRIECHRYLTMKKYVFSYLKKMIYAMLIAYGILILEDVVIKYLYFHDHTIMDMHVICMYLNIVLACLCITNVAFLLSHYIHEIYSLYVGYFILILWLLIDIKVSHIGFFHYTSIRMEYIGNLLLFILNIMIGCIVFIMLRRIDEIGKE